MAFVVADQKRKRGRSANASRDGEGASQTQRTLTSNGTIARLPANNAENEAEDETRPRKRGRKVKNVAQPETEPEPEPEVSNRAEPPQKKKRGRPSLSQKPQPADESGIEDTPTDGPKPKPRKRGAATAQQAPEEDQDSSVVVAKNQHPKKRGRPSLSKSQAISEDAQPVENAQRKKKGRPRQAKVKDKTETAEEADDENEGKPSPRRSGRARRQTIDGDPSLSSSPQHVQDQTKDATAPVHPKKVKKRGRPSAENQADANANANASAVRAEKAKKGKPRNITLPSAKKDTKNAAEMPQKGRRSRPSLNQDPEPVTKQKPRRRKKQEQEKEQTADEAEADQESESEEQPKKQPLKQKRRRRTPPEADERQSRSPSPPPYRHITSRTQRIPRQSIQDKWSPLDTAAINSVTNFLHSASRPVLLRLNNMTKHAQATSALHTIRNRLRSKLSRGLPFPPPTTAQQREDELEFERTVDGLQTLEAQLDPLLHSVALLQKEKERAEKELEREYKILNTLSANARSEIRGRREQLRKVHPLVPEPKHDENNYASPSFGDLQAAEKGVGQAFSGLESEEIKGLAGQLGNHMESLRGNLQQIDGITPAIADSQAALRVALLPHLDQEVFEQVLLG